MSRRSEREDQAHRYADGSWRVFPAEPGGKTPATLHGFLDGTTDHKQIQQWWRSDPRFNVAVATGAPGPDVLDVDKHKEGDGFGAFNQLKRADLVREPMAIVRTPSGGFHAYYRGTNQRNGHVPGVHVDFRSQGGYVVAPPSRIAGRDYEVVKKQASRDTFDWSAAKKVLDPQPERQPYRPPEREREQAGDRPRDLSHLPGWVATQPEGNRNHGLFWAANRAVEAGDTATLDSLANAARAAGLDEREIDRTIASAQQSAGRAASRSFEHSSASAAAQPDPQAEAEAGALDLSLQAVPDGVPPPDRDLDPTQSLNGDVMSVNSTTESADQARADWATAARDTELDRWNALYDRAVPAPQTSMTVWERHEAGWPARDADERARYRELDARHGAEIEAGR